MKKWTLRIILLMFWLALIGAGLVSYEAYTFLNTPGSEDPQDIIITIQPGATFDRVAWDLKKAGAITDVDRFRLLAHARNALVRVKAGEYAINTGWTPEQVLYQITEGKAVLYRLALREGLTWWETARTIEQQGFARYEDFKAVIHDPAFLRDHNIPFQNAEGFLFPDTYMMKKPRSPLDRQQAYDVASTLVRTFWKKTEPVWQKLPQKLIDNTEIAVTAPTSTVEAATPSQLGTNLATTEAATGQKTPISSLSVEKKSGPQVPADIDPQFLKNLVILASLVEKETGIPSERARVAGVYSNRLQRGILLQCDPTIIYGIGESFKGQIRRSQIDDPSNRYNTYQHPGLPPGPICSSGLDALQAAFMPEKHEYLFFVATGIDGGHTFSKTLNEHNRAVQVYRARMRAAGNR